MELKTYDDQNIFAKILRKEIPTDIIYENDNAIVINDKFPSHTTHELVLPRGNYTNLYDFLNRASSAEQADFWKAISIRLSLLDHAKVYFNCGKKSGQEIFHLHAHIISGEMISGEMISGEMISG